MRTKLKVGQVINSTSCGAYVITDIDKPDKASVRFVDSGYEVETDKHSVSKGDIKDPFFPQVLGVGFLGVGNYQGKLGASSAGFNNTPEYNAWINMLQRCYYNKYIGRIEGCTAYDVVSVCKEWHNFQTFAEWYCKKRKPLDDAGLIRPNLDKEILSPKSKAVLYSPDTCCIVPSEINSMLIGMNRHKLNELPRGISKQKECYRATAKSVHNGIIYFKSTSMDECIKWRDLINQERYTFLANKYRNVLESLVYDKLTNWDKF